MRFPIPLTMTWPIRAIIGAVAGSVILAVIPSAYYAMAGNGGSSKFVGVPMRVVQGNCNNYGTNNGTMNNNCPTYNTPPRRPDGLYQSDELVGRIASAQQVGNKIRFINPRISSGAVDLQSPMEFQNLIVSCPDFARSRQGAAMTVIAIMGPIDCDIIGSKQ